MVVDYNGGGDIQKWVRRIMGLPLLPLNDIDEAYDLLQNGMPNHQYCVRLLDYAVDTWISEDAMFPR